MGFRKNLPLIIAPYSRRGSGISTWTKNMIDYSESESLKNYYYNTHTYANYLNSLTNTQTLIRIITGTILYSRLFFQVLVLIIKYKPSVLHITSSASIGLLKDLMLIWLSKLKNIPVIIHWHFGRIPTLAIQHNWEWKILRSVIHKSSFCIVIDIKSYNVLKESGFDNVINVPNPIGLYQEQKSKELISTPNHRPPGRILYVGQIIRNKGVFELVEACSQLPAIEELLLIGPYDKELKKELMRQAMIRANGIWLKFTGILMPEQVLEQLCNSPILALPSYTEGFPYTVLEAMAMGCAVVASDVGAIPEILAIETDKPCGICLPAKDVEKLRNTIISMIKDPKRTENMGKNGIERVLNNYTSERVIKEYQSIWENVVQVSSSFHKSLKN